MNETQSNLEPVFTPAEVAQSLRCHVGHVRRLFQTGRITGVKLGRLVRFRQRDLDAYLEAGEVKRKEAAA